MGGSVSSQQLSDTASITSNVVNTANGNCIVADISDNLIAIGGSNNTVSNVSQSAKIECVPQNTTPGQPACQLTTGFSNDFAAALSTELGQMANTSSNSLSQFLDFNSTAQQDLISNTISSSFSASSTLNCLTNVGSKNVFLVAGTGNAVANVNQTAVANVVSDACVSDNMFSNAATASATSTANQGNTYTSSFFSGLGDVFSALALPAIIFIVLIALIVIARVVMKRNKSGASYTPAGYAPAGYPPAGYPPADNTPAGYPPADNTASSYAPSGYPPSGYAPSGYAPSGYAPSG